MFRAGFLDNFVYVEFLSPTRIELLNSDLKLCTQLRKHLDTFEHFTPDLLLRSVGKRCSFSHCKFKCLCF